MAFQGIVTGFTPNDGQGDTLLAGAIKTNDNFRELYEALGDGTSIGIATLTQLKLSGILTATSVDVPDINISGILSAANVQVSGVVTANSFSGDLNGNVVATSFNSLGSLSVGNQVRITTAGALQNIVSAATSSLTVTGDSTLTNVTAGVVTATEFNGNFNGTFTGNSIGLSGSPDIEVGIVTANTSIGIATSAGNAYLTFPIGDSISSSDIIRAGNSILDYSLYVLKNGTQHYIRQYTSGYYNVSVGSTNAFVVSNSDSFVTDGAIAPSGVTDSDISFVVRPDTSTELRYNYNKKFETTGVGVTVFGTTESQQLSVSGVSTFSSDVNIGTAATTVDLPGLYLKGNSAEQNFITNPSISIGGTIAGNWYDTFLVDGPNLQYVRHWASNFDVNFSVPDDRIFVVSNTDGSSSVSPAGVVDGHIAFKINPETSTELRYNKVKKLETTGIGVSVTGTTETEQLNVSGVSTLTGQVSFGNTAIFGDDDKILMGDGQDLEIFHASNNSYIRQAGTGHLYIRNLADDRSIYLQSDDGTGGYATYLQANGASGNVQLFHYGSQRFATRDYGIEVTGHTETDTLNVSGVATAAGFVGPLTGDATGLSGSPSITVTNITASGNVSIAGTLTYEDVTNVDSIGLITARNGLQVDSGGINVTGNSTITGILTASEYRFPNYGSTNYTRLGSGQLIVSGLNDKGSVQVGALTTVFSMGHAPFNNNCYFSQTGEHDWVFWSGLTTTSMTVNGGISTRPHSVTLRKLYVDTNADIDGNLSVSGIATLGSHALDANDFKVGTTLNFKSSDGSTNILTLNQSGSVGLYHNTNKKFETTVSGVEVTGGLVADNLSISGVSTFTGLTRHVGVASFFDDVNFRFDDSTGKVTLGPNNELEIFHANATGNSVIKESGSGSLILAGDNVNIRNAANNKNAASFIANGSANLFYNNGKKFETTSIGASVLGTLTATAFVGDGSGLTGITTSQIAGYSAGGAGGGIGTDGSINTTGIITASSFSGNGSNLTGIVTSLVAGSNVTLGVSGGRVTINASGGGVGGGTGINVQNNGVAIGSTITQTINFNNDLEATVNGSVVTVNSTAPSQATAIALAIALG